MPSGAVAFADQGSILPTTLLNCQVEEPAEEWPEDVWAKEETQEESQNDSAWAVVGLGWREPKKAETSAASPPTSSKAAARWR